ncbi:MAG: M23 family metallopeptidase [Cyanobacteria bacterium J06598_3]
MRTSQNPFVITAATLTALVIQLTATALRQPAYGQSPSCPAAIDRIATHAVVPGETLSSIASSYQLQPQALANFNPGVGNTPAPGTTLQIPPFSGTVVNPAAGDSWQTLSERYGPRADVLFEINGCQASVPSRVFIPSTTPVATTTPTANSSAAQLPGYPLAQAADIALSYGWQPSATADELVFNNGIAFAIESETEVRSVESGTVAFVGERAGYGQLLVINHPRGIQTRYANLSDISVVVGQSVTTDTAVGSVGGPSTAETSEQTASTYLYFEVRKNSDDGWIAQDPGQYLPALELR